MVSNAARALRKTGDGASRRRRCYKVLPRVPTGLGFTMLIESCSSEHLPVTDAAHVDMDEVGVPIVANAAAM